MCKNIKINIHMYRCVYNSHSQINIQFYARQFSPNKIMCVCEIERKKPYTNRRHKRAIRVYCTILYVLVCILSNSVLCSFCFLFTNVPVSFVCKYIHTNTPATTDDRRHDRVRKSARIARERGRWTDSIPTNQ